MRRGGALSLSGVYGGSADPMPMMEPFDKQVTVRMGQANVQHWVPRILPSWSVRATRWACSTCVLDPSLLRGARRPG